MNRFLKECGYEIAGLFVVFLALIAWYLSALAIDHGVVPTTFKFMIDAIIVFTAAFFGAYSAFLLNERREERKNNETKVDALYASQFYLARQIGIVSVLEENIKDYKDHRARHLLQVPNVSSSYSSIRVDIKSLEFLLRSQYPNLLLEIQLEQERFETAVRVFNDRVEYHLNVIQPQWDKLIPNEDNEVSLQEMEAAILPRQAIAVKKLTDDVHYHIDRTSVSLPTVFNSLVEASRVLYPKTKFLSVKTAIPDVEPNDHTVSQSIDGD